MLPTCPRCWYQLRGHDVERCPECGLVTTREQRIEWKRRRNTVTTVVFAGALAALVFMPFGCCCVVLSPELRWLAVAYLAVLGAIALTLGYIALRRSKSDRSGEPDPRFDYGDESPSN